MSSLGKQIHMNRIFRHANGRILAVAADHMINYPIGMPEPLRHIEQTLAAIVEGRPSSITLNKGVAMRCFAPYAGRVPLIIQQMALTPGRLGFADHAEPEEAAAMGADAIAVAIFVKGRDELDHMKHLADTVRKAGVVGLPVVPHIYPVIEKDGATVISNTPEDVFYAARTGLEMGADFVKVPYTGSPDTYRDIVSCMPIPMVASGGPRCDTLDEAILMLRGVAASGAAGTTIGRNAWGFPDIPGTIRRLKSELGIED